MRLQVAGYRPQRKRVAASSTRGSVLERAPFDDYKPAGRREDGAQRSHEVLAPRRLDRLEDVAPDTHACRLDAQGCRLGAQGCRLDAQGCRLDAQGCRLGACIGLQPQAFYLSRPCREVSALRASKVGESRPKGFSIISRVKPDAERTCSSSGGSCSGSREP